MSFSSNLFKGFVRSAVNQVGRDGGKVISNNIYGNAHASPIKLSSKMNIENADDLIQEKEYIWVKFMWAFIISTIIPFFGATIVVYRGIVNLRKKYTTMYRIEKQPVYARDRRFTTGERFEGYTNVKIPIKVEIDEYQKSKNRFKGIGYLIIAPISTVLFLYIISKK